MQISSNLPPYPNLSTELCHFALLLSTGSIYCEFTASQHCEGQNRYERANTDRTIERHGWFDRSLRNNADRKSTRLTSSHSCASRMPSSACKHKHTSITTPSADYPTTTYLL